MKTLVLGGAGMLGHKVVQTFHANGLEVGCTIRNSLADFPLDRINFFREVPVFTGVDAANLPCLRQLLEELQPEFLLNCIGVIKQRDAASSAIPSIAINSLLPHLLAEWAAGWGGRVIHFSTDCVFSGDRGEYQVDEPSDATDLYGKSKYLGEVTTSNALTLRTSIIGRELSHFASLVEWFLAQRSGAVKGFRRAIYSGMTTQTMANLLVEIVTTHPDLQGRYQAVSEKISKYDLLLVMKDAFGTDVEILPDDDFFSDRSMVDSGLEATIGFRAPSWNSQIAEMAADPTPYGEWR